MASRGKSRYHEAGHVVVGNALGVETRYVFIGDKDEDEDCLTTYIPSTYKVEGVESAAISLAGGVAENRYALENNKPRPSEEALEGDIAQVIHIFQDLEDIEVFAQKVQEAEDLATKLVNENWDLIEKVANLFEVGKATNNPLGEVL